MITEKHNLPVFDGHNDILEDIYSSSDALDHRAFLEGKDGHLDLPRARRAGFKGGFFAVYPPNPPHIPPAKDRLIETDEGYYVPFPPPLDFDYARDAAAAMIDLIHQIASHSQEDFQVVLDYQELERCFQEDIMAAVLHLEGAEPILPDLSNLEHFLDRGVRSIGITWSRPNAFGHGVPFQTPSSPDTGPGLTEAGKELVKACNQQGILIDLAHLNEQGFWDAAEISTAPLVSSHTAANALIQRARNLTDDQLRAVADSRGVVGVIFSVNDLDGGKRPKADAPLSAIVRHIAYIAELVGVEHVAFGSDLDGTVIPSEFGDVEGFPRLLTALKEGGFNQEELEKISWRNWFRVLKDTWHGGEA